MSISFKTPVLLLIFNRPVPTAKVFSEIRKARPEKLFIAADGPRPDRPDDIENCRLARAAVSNVDWPCEVKTLFQEKNHGCKIGATTGITWFFDNVEEGMIIEDDCLPDPSFFPFCEQLLEKFRYTENVCMISGYNGSSSTLTPYSYFYSRYGHLWGWASWRRIWKQYDVTMKVWASKANRRKIKREINDKNNWDYRQWLYQETFEGRKDTWDYQWETYRLFHRQYSIIPEKNLIENLGFGPDATHTKRSTSYLIKKREALQFPLIHNTEKIAPLDAYDKQLGPLTPAYSMRVRKIRQVVKRILKTFGLVRA